MNSKLKLRKKFEQFITKSISQNTIVRPGIIDRTSGNPGILRDYKNQETELSWRAFKTSYENFRI